MSTLIRQLHRHLRSFGFEHPIDYTYTIMQYGCALFAHRTSDRALSDALTGWFDIVPYEVGGLIVRRRLPDEDILRGTFKPGHGFRFKDVREVCRMSEKRARAVLRMLEALAELEKNHDGRTPYWTFREKSTD